MSYKKQQEKLIQSISQNSFSSTIIPIKESYENNELCLTSLTFLAQDIAREIDNKIISRLKKISPEHYYPPPEDLHITLKNIRTVHDPPLFTDEDVKKTLSVYERVSQRNTSFSFELKKLAHFPTSISLIGFSDNTLHRLVDDLDCSLKNAGVPDNKKYLSNSIFFGNVTLCRFTSKPSNDFLKMLESLKEISIGSFKVKNISLITCNAVCSKKNRTIHKTFNLK
jgi:2'-5' RNA ligase